MSKPYSSVASNSVNVTTRHATLPKKNAGRVLIVDDTPTNLFILSKLLDRAGYEVDQTTSGPAAIQLAKVHRPDLILLDIMMPEMDGYEVCYRLRQDEQTAHIPVIFLSALNTSGDKVQGFDSGAADYVTKPFQPEEILARVRYQIQLQNAKVEQQLLNSELESRVHERTQLLELAHSQLLEVALTDRLTRLPNRQSFVKRLSKLMAQAQDQPDKNFAVLFLDCDRFKRINDSLGHRIGDQLLKGVARRLLEMRYTNTVIDTVARFGGDEFALLLWDVEDRLAVEAVAEELIRHLARPFFLVGKDIFVNASVGLVWGEPDYVAAEHLLRDADVAMYQAKDCAHIQYQWFESDMHRRVVKELQMETDMRLAIERQEFELYYQPIVDLEQMRIVSFEALIRWNHPTRGLISPNDFIPFAEESGFIVDLGKQVLSLACRDIARWEKNRLLPPYISISVNIAAEQLLQPDILAQVQTTLESNDVAPHRLRLELTERSIITNYTLVDEVLRAFKLRNIQMSIDDFGTGYSALSYLHQLPVNYLKVDRSFVKPITKDNRSLGIVPLILNMAETMNMQVIAEGIENITQLKQMRSLGCKYGQGYFFQRPLPAEQAVSLLHRSPSDWTDFATA